MRRNFGTLMRSLKAALLIGLSSCEVGMAQEGPVLSKEPTGGNPTVLAQKLLEEVRLSEQSLQKKDPAVGHQQAALLLMEQLLKELDRQQQQESSQSSSGSPEPKPQGSEEEGSGKKSSSKARDQESAGKQNSEGKESSTKPDGKTQMNSGKGGENEEASDSQAGHRERERARLEAERKRQLEVDVWGHLPDSVRGELLNSFDERVLPSYEKLVRKYYEALAESGPQPGSTTPRGQSKSSSRWTSGEGKTSPEMKRAPAPASP